MLEIQLTFNAAAKPDFCTVRLRASTYAQTRGQKLLRETRHEALLRASAPANLQTSRVVPGLVSGGPGLQTLIVL
jgi:hypothetical protein